MISENINRKKVVSLWLPIAILFLGLVFLIFVIIEYQRNLSIIQQNKNLISNSAKSRIQSNILKRDFGSNWADLEQDYQWIKTAPSIYWFNSGKQEFPWARQHLKNAKVEQKRWQDIWLFLNSSSLSKNDKLDINQSRLALLKKIKSAIDENDDGLITQSFNNYLDHLNAYHLSPQEEIAFSLILIEIGAEQHWSKELIHAILITGGKSESPIIRPVVDLLFRNASHFSLDDFDWITNKVIDVLETFNLSSYFLKDYALHLKSPSFILPNNIDIENKNLNTFSSGNWFLRKVNNTVISAEPVVLIEELKLVELELIEQGILEQQDSLSLINFSGNEPLDDIVINVNKAQLNQDSHNQAVFLIIKSLLIIAFMVLVLLNLRLIEKNQKRRLEYLSLREDFVKLVSHELKTPLAGIRAMAETLQKRAQRNLDIQTYPQRIVNEADKLWYMVDNILGFNRVQLTDIVIDKQLTRIVPLCEGVIEDVRSFSNKPYSVLNALPENLEAMVDVDLFSLVIKNIIVNSGLYNDQPIIEIGITFDEKSSSLLISDNGVGIAESDQDKVFEPFIRLSQTSRQSGTGLGLAICKRIMKLHNGDLALASSNNSGSTWKIEFEKQQMF